MDFPSQVVTKLEPSSDGWRWVGRSGRPWLALPDDRTAAERTLRLYQPQRAKAKLMAALLRTGVKVSIHRLFTLSKPVSPEEEEDPSFPPVTPGSVGVMAGNPEHRIPRAIACYHTAHGWEVAKVAGGPEGRALLEHEAQVMGDLYGRFPGVPRPLGLHRRADTTWLRLPYLDGRRPVRGEESGIVALLDTWVLPGSPRPLGTFPEWAGIRAALETLPGGPSAIGRLARENLLPVVRHGDFARWNLVRDEEAGRWLALDWEWGLEGGMAGLDLVHFHGQDTRLVDGFPANPAVGEIIRRMSVPDASHHLRRVGWTSPLGALLAGLAFKQGAGHQDHHALLEACLAAYLAA